MKTKDIVPGRLYRVKIDAPSRYNDWHGTWTVVKVTAVGVERRVNYRSTHNGIAYEHVPSTSYDGLFGYRHWTPRQSILLANAVIGEVTDEWVEAERRKANEEALAEALAVEWVRTELAPANTALAEALRAAVSERLPDMTEWKLDRIVSQSGDSREPSISIQAGELAALLGIDVPKPVPFDTWKEQRNGNNDS